MGVINSQRTLEITVFSCDNINVPEEAYVVVRGESLNCHTTRMAAKDDNNSSFLLWNEKFFLNMPLHAKSITFEVQCKKFKALRPVGVARIAVSDIIIGGAVPVLSYRLRDWEGKLNGVIHFGVRVVQEEEVFTSGEEMKKETVASSVNVKGCGGRLTGIDHGEVVTGFPFWWNYQNNIV